MVSLYSYSVITVILIILVIINYKLVKKNHLENEATIILVPCVIGALFPIVDIAVLCDTIDDFRIIYEKMNYQKSNRNKELLNRLSHLQINYNMKENIKNNFKIISNNKINTSKLYTKEAYSIIAGLANYCEECEDKGTLNKESIINTINNMASEVDRLLQQYTDEILDVNDKAKKHEEELLLEKGQNFIKQVKVNSDTRNEYNND